MMLFYEVTYSVELSCVRVLLRPSVHQNVPVQLSYVRHHRTYRGCGTGVEHIGAKVTHSLQYTTSLILRIRRDPFNRMSNQIEKVEFSNVLCC